MIKRFLSSLLGLNKRNFFRFSLLIFCIRLVCQLQFYQVSGNECGTVDMTVPLIIGGNRSVRGEWPFVAALFLTEKSKFLCGATVISTRHVLTAAHCVQEKYWAVKLRPPDVTVRLGGYNLAMENERGVVQVNVDEIHIHPEWDVYDDKYDADLAVFFLSQSVNFTNFIRPVCMPTDDAVIGGATGTVVGWGFLENGTHEEYPSHAISIALNNSYCYTADYGIAMFSSSRTFCGGGGEGGPNRGDSGGGFFVRNGTAWVQHGIISALRTNAIGIVSTNSFAIYTNVKSFKNWIAEIVAKTGHVVMTVGQTIKIQINLNCDYESYNTLYSCRVRGFDIQSEHLEVTSFIGSHKDGLTNQDVDNIIFVRGTMFYLPYGIGMVFKNLKHLSTGRRVRLKLLRRENFKNLENLVDFNFYMNDIGTVDEDSLWDLPNLESLNLSGNKLKVLHERTWEKNTKLISVDLSDNQLEFLPRDLFKNNLLLKKVFFDYNNLKIIESNFAELKNLKLISLHRNVCIDVTYSSDYNPANLNDFQSLLNLVALNCSANNNVLFQRSFDRYDINSHGRVSSEASGAKLN